MELSCQQFEWDASETMSLLKDFPSGILRHKLKECSCFIALLEQTVVEMSHAKLLTAQAN